MATPVQAAHIAKIASALSTKQAERSLASFIQQAWPIIEPDTPFKWNWHLDGLCLHAEAWIDGRIKNLLVNVPPGSSKSIVLSVMLNAWAWTTKPWLKFLATAYGDNIAIRDNLKVRQIVESEWYQRRWGDKVKLSTDQNQKSRYSTTRKGFRIGVPLTGGITGEHPHFKVVDDPHSTKKAMSPEERRNAVIAFDQGLSSRGASLNAGTLVVMQRLHQADLSGHIIDRMPERYTHICLPMRYEPPALNADGVLMPRMPMTPLGWQDPRRQAGELLWPDLFPEATVKDLELALGAYGAAGQLQQRPSPEGGGMFRREWFRVVDAVPAEARVIARSRGWDGAATENAGDYTAGVRMCKTSGQLYFIEHVVRGQWGPAAADAVMMQTVQGDPKGTRQREEQEPGSAGKKLVLSHAILLQGYDYRGEPSTGDKATRARPFAAQAEVGNISLVRGDWNTKFLDEMCSFPFGTHDDQVDATAKAFNEIALIRGVMSVPISGY